MTKKTTMTQTPVTEQPAGKTPATDASNAPATPSTLDQGALSVAEPSPVLSATGLPVDEFHGQGGTFLIQDGVRVRID